MLFDEILGRFADLGGRPRARSAYLNTNSRSITPLETELNVNVEFVSEVGRKRLMRGEIRHGDVLCAEADLLLVTLKAHQP